MTRRKKKRAIIAGIVAIAAIMLALMGYSTYRTGNPIAFAGHLLLDGAMWRYRATYSSGLVLSGHGEGLGIRFTGITADGSRGQASDVSFMVNGKTLVVGKPVDMEWIQSMPGELKESDEGGMWWTVTTPQVTFGAQIDVNGDLFRATLDWFEKGVRPSGASQFNGDVRIQISGCPNVRLPISDSEMRRCFGRDVDIEWRLSPP